MILTVYAYMHEAAGWLQLLSWGMEMGLLTTDDGSIKQATTFRGSLSGPPALQQPGLAVGVYFPWISSAT